MLAERDSTGVEDHPRKRPITQGSSDLHDGQRVLHVGSHVFEPCFRWKAFSHVHVALPLSLERSRGGHWEAWQRGACLANVVDVVCLVKAVDQVWPDASSGAEVRRPGRSDSGIV
jgi:hypothetical protein